MSRRKPSKVRTRSLYLNPEHEAVQDALRSTAFGKRKRKNMTQQGGYLGFHGQGQFHQGGSTYVSCDHDGSVAVFEHDGKQLFGSSWQGLKEYSDKWGLIIDLAGNVRPSIKPVPFVKDVSTERFHPLQELALQMTESKMKAELLSLDWPDMGIPRAGLAFWRVLWGSLPAKTVIACQGGHGRTGTCIASLMIATGVDYYSALTAVRADHCKKAVETHAQEMYLHSLYKSALKLALGATTTSPADRADFEKDLIYADANPPKANDLRGHSALHGGSTSVTTIDPIPSSSFVGFDTGGDIEGTNYKTWPIMGSEAKMMTTIIGQTPYVKACINPACLNGMCESPAHMGWMPDFVALSADKRLTDEEEEIIFNGTNVKLQILWDV